MNDFFLAELQKMAVDEKLDFVVRYSAVLQLGELNSVELTKIGGGAESPLPAALPVLLGYYQDTKAHSAVRMAALVGLLRHARLGVADDAQRKQLQGVLFALLNETKAPADVDDDAHLYLRRRAAQGLGWLGLPGTSDGGTEVYDALLAIVNDDKQSMQFRADAARAIGGLRLQGANGVDLAALVQSLGALALESLEGGGDEVLGKAKLDEVPAEKGRPLQFCLKSVKLTLRGPDFENQTGLTQVDAGEKTNKLIVDLAKGLEDLSTEQKDADKRVIPISKKVETLRELLAGKPAAPPAETDPETGDPATEGTAKEGDAAEGDAEDAEEGATGKSGR
jgi:hypothetical protein